MILQALCNLCDAEQLLPETDLQTVNVAWFVCLDGNGQFLGLRDNRTNANAKYPKRKPRMVGQPLLCPHRRMRTNNIVPDFLVDNSVYVWGNVPEPDGTVVATPKPSKFAELVGRAAEATNDRAIAAVHVFLTQPPPGQLFATFKDGDGKAGDMVGFLVDDQPVHLRPAARSFWSTFRHDVGPPAATDWHCMVSGKRMPNVPKFDKIKKIPGAMAYGISLVSFNIGAAESFGWKENENGPVSVEAIDKVVAALDRLLSGSMPHPGLPGVILGNRRVKLGKEAVALMWAKDPTLPAVESMIGLLDGDRQDQVVEAYRAAWTGRQVLIANPDRFYLLVLGASDGRVIVRSWIDETMRQALDNISDYFADLSMVRSVKNKEGELWPMSLRRMADALYEFDGSDQQASILKTSLLQSALTGVLFPDITAYILTRFRATVHMQQGVAWRRETQAALLKAILNRRKRLSIIPTSYPEVPVALKPDLKSTGYTLGMLLSAMERIQNVALGGVKASIVDRFYGSASATPQTTFARLLQNYQHHKSRALRVRQGYERYLAVRLTNMIDFLTTRLTTLPPRLSAEDQAMFAIGFHQMCHWLWMKKEERLEWQAANLDAHRVFHWVRAEEKEEETEAA